MPTASPHLPPPHTQAQIRIPSNMRGFKKTVYEGGLRQYLLVRGPGVAGGKLDHTLVSSRDFVPPVVELAGITQVRARE